MLPVLIQMGPIKIYSMGVMLFIAAFVGLYKWWTLGREEHFEEVDLFDSFFLALFAFLLTGRVGYVLANYAELGTMYRAIAILSYPGISYVIGILGATIAVLMYARNRAWDAWKTFDNWVVTLALIIAIASFGGLLNGSNPGIEAKFGIPYPGLDGKYAPLDAITLVSYLIIFIVVMRVKRNFRFYEWYKTETGVAKEGLSALVFGFCTGLYLMIIGFLDDGARWLQHLPVVSIIGLFLALIFSYFIFMRTGEEKQNKIRLRVGK